MRPRWMMAIRSQSFSASLMMWVEKRIVFPSSRSSRMIRCISRAFITSSPTVGSSKISTGGSWATVRAIDTFCFIPVESFSTRASSYSPIPKRSTRASTLRGTRSAGWPLMRAKKSRVSRAVRRG